MSKANGKAPIRLVHENGKPVAFVRAKTAAQAVRHYTRKKYEAPIADQDMLWAHGTKLPLEEAGADDEAEQAELRG